jgi:hypothetical protein
MTDGGHGVTAAMCAELRRAAKQGRKFSALATSYDLPYATVASHVRGNCDHSIPEPPAPLE